MELSATTTARAAGLRATGDVHPAVLESYLDGSLLEGMRARARQRLQGALKPGARAGAGTGPTA